MSRPQKAQLTRVSGPRSSTGCQTCRLRRVKCDEQKPSCRRCAVAKRACVYVAVNTTPAPAKFIMYGLAKQPDASLQFSPHERRALHHFQCRTKDNIQGPFRSTFWTSVVPTLAETDSLVRQAVVALSNMHEHYLGSGSEMALNSALHHYQKTLRSIVKLESPEESFDAVLTSCIILHSFESLRGAFNEATQHATAGAKMIVSRRGEPENKSSIVSNEVLSELLLELHAQIIEANNPGYNAHYFDFVSSVVEIPKRFNTVEEALPHFHVLGCQSMRLFEQAEEYHELHPFVPGVVAPPLQEGYQTLLATFDAWNHALGNIESVVHSGGRQQYEGYLVLKIFQLSIKIDLDIFVKGESAYDSFTMDNFGIIKLIEVLLEVQEDHGFKQDSGPRHHTTFVTSLGIVSLLFEIATRTNNERLREEALKVLRCTNRREGIWDSRVAVRLAERIVEMKREGSMVTDPRVGQKFVITDIQLLSDEKVKLTYGFKNNAIGSFQSFWLEDIKPGEGTVRTETIDVAPGRSAGNNM